MNFEPFLNDLQTVRACSPQTIRSYRHDLKLFDDFARERSIMEANQIDRAIVLAFIAWMRQKPNPRTGRPGLADTSIARRLAALSTFLEYVRQTDDDVENPVKKLGGKWHRDSKPNPVDEYDLDLLLASIAQERDRVLFLLLVATGLRVSELQRLNRDSITIEVEPQPNGKFRATGRGEVIGKGGKRRTFYVDHNTIRVYANYLKSRKDNEPALFISQRGQRMSVRAIQERLVHWCTQIGFRPINVHRLRHTFATRLANANIPSNVLKELMGHSSFATTQKYFKLSDATLSRRYFAAMEQIAGSWLGKGGAEI